MTKSPDQDRAITLAISQIEKEFGKGAIMKLGDSSSLNVEAIPTGCIALDLALGIGGIPRGRITEIFGPEASGKTTLCQHVIAECQKRGGVAAFVDVEHALDPSYAAKCGGNIDDLYISQPDTGEQGLEITEALVRSGAVDVVVVDSVAALVPQAEIEGDMGEAHMGLQARLMSQALRKLTGAIKRSNTAVIFTNQLRMKIGVLFGNPETTSGGNALKYYAAVRLDMRKMEAIKQKTEVIGNRVRVRIKKNKVAPPFKMAEFDIMFDHGISKEGSLLDVGVEAGIIEKRGAFYSFNDTRLGQGRENAKDFLREHPEITEQIESEVRGKADFALKGMYDEERKSGASEEDEGEGNEAL